MVDITGRLDQIQEMVDQGDYFCINRGRQYGKTTTMALLKNKLEPQYIVFSISFEGIGEASFASGESLGYAFLYLSCYMRGEAFPTMRMTGSAISHRCLVM